MNFPKMILMMTVVTLFSCTQAKRKSSKAKILGLSQSGDSHVVAIADNTSDTGLIKNLALTSGLKVQGDEVLRISGNASSFEKFEEKVGESQLKYSAVVSGVVEDGQRKQRIEIKKPNKDVVKTANSSLSPAKVFGLNKFWKSNPTFDGRGVVIGVVDGGIDVELSGFQKTTDGKRKIIGQDWRSTLLDTKLEAVTEIESRTFTKSAVSKNSALRVWQGEIDENRLDTTFDFAANATKSKKKNDINFDGKIGKISLAVLETENKVYKVCVDIVVDETVEKGECFGEFNETGEYGYWFSNETNSFTVDFNADTQVLRLNQGNAGIIGHGVAVAGVAGGHNIGGLVSGVAPGVQFWDFDTHELSANLEENSFAFSLFVGAIERAAKNGVDIITNSWSIGFNSPKTQEFYERVVQRMIDKHKIMVVFGAGNDGPGLFTLGITGYQIPDVITVGGLTHPELHSASHGSPNVPKNGVVALRSNRGPFMDYGISSFMIAPQGAFTHGPKGRDFLGFSGTSSATPAMSGFVAVLISAIRQLELSPELPKGFDVTAVTHAVRQSAKKIESESYLDQGYGLPRIQKAIEIYKNIVSGNRLAGLSTVVANEKTEFDLPMKGLFFRDSEIKSRATRKEYEFVVRGIVPSHLRKISAKEILREIKLIPSHDWISVPKSIWASGASSASARLLVYVDLDKAKTSIQENDEIAGKIDFVDFDDASEKKPAILHTIPVVFVNDTELKNKIDLTETLSTGESKRKHLFVPGSAVGVRLSVNENLLSERNLYLNWFDRYGKINNNYRIDKTNSEVLISNNNPGWSQLGLGRRFGASTSELISVSVEPVKLKVENTIEFENSKIRLLIENQGRPQNVVLEVRQAPQIVINKRVSLEDARITFEEELTRPGTYELSWSSNSTQPQRTHENKCMWEFYSKESGKLVKYERNNNKAKIDERVKVVVRCVFEEYSSLEDDKFRIEKVIQISKLGEKTFYSSNHRIDSGRSTISGVQLPEMGEYKELNVVVKSPFGKGEFEIGRIKLVE